MALKETGIRLVADNSNVFLSTLNNATNAVSGFEKGVHSVASAPFNLVNSALGTFGSAIGNISQVISGILGAGLIVNLASQISSMSTQAFQAAGQFQLLQIQMEGLIAIQLTDQIDKVTGATLNMADAQKQAAEPAAELLDWISDFAVKAPYTVLQISEMSRDFLSLGKDVPNTKKYIKGFTSLAAGMGLSNAQLDRLVQNFVQTSRSMKITERDIREYGNSGLPVNRILDDMAKKLGITRVEAIEFAKDGIKGVEAFNESIVAVATKDFPNSLDRLSKTWAVAMSNIQDVVESVFGKEILGPLASNIAEFVGGIIDKILSMREWFREVGVVISQVFTAILPEVQKLIPILVDIGTTILKIFGIDLTNFNLIDFIKSIGTSIQGFLVNLQSFGTMILPYLHQFSDWFVINALPAIKTFLETGWKILWDAIVVGINWITSIGIPALKSFSKWFVDEALPAIKKFLDESWNVLVKAFTDGRDFVNNKLIPVLNTFSKWFTDEGKPAIEKVIKSFSDLKDTFNKSTPDITGAIKLIGTDTEKTLGIAVPTILDNLKESYKDLAKVVSKSIDDMNKSWEENHLTVLGVVVIAVRLVVATILGAITLLSGGISAALKAINGDWDGAWKAMGETVNTFFDIALGVIGSNGDEFYKTWKEIFDKIPQAASDALNGIGWFIYNKIVENIRNMMTMFRWAGFLIGYDMIVGVMEGMDLNAFAIKNKFFSIIWDAVKFAENLMWIHSPSLRTRLMIGQPLGEGVALGIMDSMGMVSAAMGNLSAQVSPPASSSQINSSSSTQYNNSSSYNLSVNSSQNSSGVVQDFSLMRAMA